MNNPYGTYPGAAASFVGRGRVFEDASDAIGNTPLVRLSRLTQSLGVQSDLLLKLEYFNPAGSVKDRIAVAMMDDLEQRGEINSESVIVEPTSGNTGIGLAFVCASRGYRLVLTMPESMSYERRKMLSHLGAELELTPAKGGMRGAINRAMELLETIPNSVMPGQFENPANPAIHQQTTAEEIWYDTGGHIDVLVCGVGTGGTLTGCARVLKARNPSLWVVAVEPEASPVISGGEAGPHKIQGIGPGFIPPILETEYINEVITVDNSTAMETAKSLAKLEGIPGGISTGANCAAALTLAVRPEMTGKTIVTFAPSFAERYLSTEMFMPQQS